MSTKTLPPASDTLLAELGSPARAERPLRRRAEGMTTLDELRRLSEAATPGRYEQYLADGGAYIYAPDARYEAPWGSESPVKVAWMPPSVTPRPGIDAAFIVAAVNYVRELLTQRLSAAEQDAGTCPTCGDWACIGRLQYENCRTAPLSLAARQQDGGERG